MSKKIFLLIIFLFTHLFFLPHSALAAGTCKDSKIDWKPKSFLDGQDEYILNFTVQNNTVLETIKRDGQYLRLLVNSDYFWEAGKYTHSVKVENNQFSFILTDSLTKNGLHSGVIQWSPTENGAYGDFCTDVIYQVGAATGCRIDPSIPDRIPPKTSLAVSFVGKPDTEYNLQIISGIGFSPKVGSKTTDKTGQGTFDPIIIPDKNGESITLQVSPGPWDVCEKTILIDAGAPLPSPRPSGPVQPVPAAPIIKKCKAENDTTPLDKRIEMICVSGGGDPCDTSDNRGPAFKTAIGCIHTNPNEFAKDLMTWVIGIGGGIAFLMMLLGAFQMLTSAGNPDTLRAGRERLTSAVIGLLIVIFAVLLLQIIGIGILNIPGFGS